MKRSKPGSILSPRSWGCATLPAHICIPQTRSSLHRPCLVGFLFWFLVLGFELKAFTLTCSTSPVFCDRIFWDRVSWTVCLGWLRTLILISASWVARITGVSHRHLALFRFYGGSTMWAWWIKSLAIGDKLRLSPLPLRLGGSWKFHCLFFPWSFWWPNPSWSFLGVPSSQSSH
jgi:hypothetical protein